MTDGKSIREPKQQRSLEKKQRVIHAAKELFCQKGYYNTTTNEIAKHAKLSIGTLYSYFEDKDAILVDLLEQYNEYFSSIFEQIQTDLSDQLFKEDKRRWLSRLVRSLVRLHEPQTDFYRELNSLYYTNHLVAEIMDIQEEKIRQATLQVMQKYRDHIPSDGLDALSVVIVDYTNALVDRIVFKKTMVDKQRVLEVGVEGLYQMVMKGQA